MGRIVTVKGDVGSLEVEVLDMGARHARLEADDVEYECELVGIEGSDIFVRVGSDIFVVHRTPKGDIVVNGRLYEIKSGGGQTVSASGEERVSQIKAVMPGLVVKVMVQVGDEVKAGDPILVLEAMKMENQVKSPGVGRVKAIRVKEGQAVESGDVLVEFE